ncbi:MAG: M23 family metallopeptidase [Bacteroidales bacterium]|nr:M23 family metallopeptidase [Bacteroidales bacterium]
MKTNSSCLPLNPLKGTYSPFRGLGGNSWHLASGIILFLLLLFNTATVSSQTNYPQTLFRSPVDLTILLSGSYGEIRPNHFHSGIDIRTAGVTGKPVYAASNGYVSRIFVSPWGFGKAIYINHPEGYTTVYGHLDRFGGEIAKYAYEQQYVKESFAIDVTVPTGKIQVRKGEIIGYTGNSGSSGGPHLHFEIRDAGSQEPLDPLSFGIPISDNLPPQITWVKIYPYGQTAMVNFTSNPKSLQATGGNGTYAVSSSDTVMVSGDIIFGIEAYDYHNGSSIRCGVKSIELRVDGVKIFGQHIERYAFADTRYVNAILDYPQNMKNKQRFFKSYIAPGNKLRIFDDVINRGVVNFSDRKAHKIQYVVKDVRGNSSRITFWVKSHPPASAGARPSGEGQPANLFVWDEENSLENSYISFTIPKNSLYENLDFRYESKPPANGSYSRIHVLHDKNTPLHLRCSLSVKAENLPNWLEKRALLVKVEDGGKFVSMGGKFSDGMVTGSIREFGEYTISVDTVPPKIKAVNIYNNKNVSKQGTIVVTISDEFSGIDSYRGTLNGHWILMDFDAKRNRLEYKFDSRIKTGSNKFQLVVTDGVGNRTEYNATLIR